jgi:hypothetical protein
MLNYQRVRCLQYETLAAIFFMATLRDITKQVHYCTTCVWGCDWLYLQGAQICLCIWSNVPWQLDFRTRERMTAGEESRPTYCIGGQMTWEYLLYFLPHTLSRWHERGFDPTHVQAHDLRVASVYVMTYLWISRERKMSYVIGQTHVSCPVLFFSFQMGWRSHVMSSYFSEGGQRA